MMTRGNHQNSFITPEDYAVIRQKQMRGPNGWLLFVACLAGQTFASQVKQEYVRFLRARSKVHDFPLLAGDELPHIHPDQETRPRLEDHVAGSNAFVFQCVHDYRDGGKSPNENIVHLLQTIYTLKAHGARTVTAVTPYSPYSRQDRASFRKREAALAGWFARELKNNGACIHLIYHPHTYAIEGCYDPQKIRLVALSGLDLFREAFSDKAGKKDVIVVSTDIGGAKVSGHFATDMKLQLGIADKARISDTETTSIGVIGDFNGKRRALWVDDEASTFGTVYQNLKRAHAMGLESEVGISHLKLNDTGVQRLQDAHAKYGLKLIHVTDTIPQPKELLKLGCIRVHPLARTFARVVNHLHYDQSVSKLSYHT